MKKKILLNILLLFGISTVYCNDWRMYRCDVRGSSHQEEVAHPPLTHQWSYDTFSDITASPIVANNKLFIGNHLGAFYAFDAQTGDVLWQYSAENRIDSAGCYYDGKVYFGSRDGRVYAVDADNGTLNWSSDLDSTIIGSPIIYMDRLYIGAGSPLSTVVVLDPQTGQQLGSIDTLQPVQSVPCFNDTYVYVGSNDGAVYRVDVSNLAQSWKCQTVGSFEQSCPTVGEEGLYISPCNDEKKIYRLDLNFVSGDIGGLAQDESDDLASTYAANKTSSPSIFNGSVFISTGASAVSLIALNETSLTQKLWEYSLGNVNTETMLANPTLDQNCVYAVTFDGRLVALEQDNGNLLYENSISVNSLHSQPAVSNGYIYCATYEGVIKAYKANEIVSIVSPREGDVITSTASVIGTVQVNNISSVELAYGSGDEPSVWTVAATKLGNFENSHIGYFNTAELADGEYTIKLTANTSPVSSRLLYGKTHVTVNLPPAAPANAALTEAPVGLTLSWNLSADDGAGDNDVTSYRIFRSTVSGSYGPYLDSVSNGVRTYADTDLESGVTYYYAVRAYDGLSESANSNEASNLNTDETAWVKLPSASGGEVTLEDGTKVVFPPGALSEDFWVLIKTLHDGEYPSGGMDSRYNAVNIIREFQIIPETSMQQIASAKPSAQENLIRELSESVSFQQLVTIYLPYSGSSVNISDEKKLRILWYDTASSRWKIINTSAPDTAARVVTARVSKFAMYQAAEFVPSGALLEKDKVYTYPNPAKGDILYFKYFSGDDCVVDIDVYNVAGERIAHLTGEGSAGLVSEIPWDIKKYASGIYVYMVEAKSKYGNAKKKIIKKLAIIK